MRLFTLSLRSKVFAAIFLTSIMTICVVALLVLASMRDGFSRYLLDAELNRFGLLSEALVDQHDENAPGWPEFQDEPHIWKDFVRHNWQSGPGEGQSGEAEENPPRSGEGDGLQIGQRIFLLNVVKDPVVIGRDYGGEFALRPIVDLPDGPILGWLGMSMPDNGQVGADIFYLSGQFSNLLWAVGIAALISFLAAAALSQGLLRPIRRLAIGARVLADGDYEKRITNDRSDELGDLIQHYNQLAAVLEQKTLAERIWVSDTSHELQTPLAVLQAQIEAMQDGIRPADDHTLLQLHAGVLRLSALVQDLKALAFDHEGQLVINPKITDMSDVISDAIESIEPRMAQVGLTVQFDAQNEVLINADPARIRQVLDNLLENAVRYTSAGGSVQVTIIDRLNRYVVTVEDSAPGPALQDLPHLFERFYRPDTSRSRETGGSGLGLSVSRAIIEAHGGTISASPSPLGGLKVIFDVRKGTNL